MNVKFGEVVWSRSDTGGLKEARQMVDQDEDANYSTESIHGDVYVSE